MMQVRHQLEFMATLHLHPFATGCKLIFLPPYSPDYNPIEFAFSSIKAFLRRHWKENTLSLSSIHHACDNVGPWKAYEWFKACGYCN